MQLLATSGIDRLKTIQICEESISEASVHINIVYCRVNAFKDSKVNQCFNGTAFNLAGRDSAPDKVIWELVSEINSEWRFNKFSFT
ncbi:hypothetical protein GCM10007103_04690 [Salinimicrobium marinum]|uniref:Uncharacterized protein n=1 Tax=Salinimicrobium marinum TaxID=680283 RepID=A0A918VUU5_9FLAO|nr:hypothetical protein GCM10007103_04690 [Salinimicrobium marinum]